ncbi:O-methyltransferase-domain-containing protein [Glomus cerebriforme]|uniref:O-methyltransferase-domain-containing protein n=1 Tax=Glomus cerebriforme TaxID=658196 RepID=A0A397SLF9_9GLOM|nr:O-methyltransferase-domain-containing protein [Glomus cerebriforme]
MFFYNISKTFLSNSRIISRLHPKSFPQATHFKLLQQYQSFYSSPQCYSNEPFLFLKSGPYSVANSTPQPAHLQKVYDKTLKEFHENESEMMVSSLQGSLLTLLCKLMNAKKVLEIGCFTGYSALCFAEGIKNSGTNAKVVTCEYDQKYAKIALQNVKEAGKDDLIEIKIGDGLETIRKFDKSTVFDLIYIDADKAGYINYYETILERNLLSEKGLIVADNVLFSGYVERLPNYDPNAPKSSENHIPKEIYKRIVVPLYNFNEHVNKDSRTTNLLLPGFDGLMLIQKN